ncbi:FAD dependent oxidoreductase [Gorgonomyces haynaldii]|nr:FAD dependent oxidoreductase [Gorgonomyces haynaldii]
MFPERNPTKSGYWLSKMTNPWQKPLQSITDVLVIGCGISGASIVHHLVQLSPNTDIVVMEARQLSGGATGRNGGLLWPSMPDRWSTLVQTYGMSESKRMLEFSLENCKQMQQFCDQLDTNDPLYPHLHQFKDGALHLMDSKEDFEIWKQEIANMKQNGGVLDIDTWTTEQVVEKLGPLGKHYYGAVHDKLAFRIRPAYFVYHLMKQAVQKGSVNVHTECLVQSVKKDGDVFVVKSGHGEIRAKKVVYCTNAYTDALVKYKIKPIRNQVIVTEPLTYMFDIGVTANSGYEYFSQREDGRIILGGMRYLAPNSDVGNGDDAHLNEKVSKGLRHYLKEQFPRLATEVQEEWAGIMGWTEDKLPLVGGIPNRPGEYIVAGFSGHGMPRAHLSAKACVQEMLGLEMDPYFPMSFHARTPRISKGSFKSTL